MSDVLTVIVKLSAVGAQNFSDSPDVFITVIVGALIGLVLLMPIGAELGKRAGADEAAGKGSSEHTDA